MVATRDGIRSRQARRGAGIARTAFKYDGLVVLSEDRVVKARTLVDGQWSALNEASFTLATPSLKGDFSADGMVDADDIDSMFREVASQMHRTEFDLNQDGKVDPADVDELVLNILDTRYGDANLDGRVDMADFALLADHFGTAGDLSWRSGDFDGDKIVSFRDFVLLANRFESGEA